MIKQMDINVKLDEGAFMPEYAHKTDAGADIRTPIDVVIMPHGGAKVHTGVHILIPEGLVGNLWSKSGLNINKDIIGVGVIDSSYSGEIIVKLYNLGDSPYEFKRGGKIIQIEIQPVVYGVFHRVEDLGEQFVEIMG